MNFRFNKEQSRSKENSRSKKKKINIALEKYVWYKFSILRLEIAIY